MTTSARPVIIAAPRGKSVRLTLAPNGTTWTLRELAALCVAAGVIPKATPRGLWVTEAEFADVCAAAQYRSVTLRMAKAGL
jgi:hypothetical protein